MKLKYECIWLDENIELDYHVWIYSNKWKDDDVWLGYNKPPSKKSVSISELNIQDLNFLDNSYKLLVLSSLSN